MPQDSVRIQSLFSVFRGYLGQLFAQWGECETCTADFNGDGKVDGQDLGLLFVAWGPCD